MPSDLREVVKSALPDIAVAIEEWLFNGAADDQAAANIAALIRPTFEAKEREIERAEACIWSIANDKCDAPARKRRAQNYLKGRTPRPIAILSHKLSAAEAALHELRMQALSDEGQMRELQAKLAQAVGELSGLQQAILDAAVICDDDEKAGDRLDKLARAIRARSASEHLTDRGVKT